MAGREARNHCAGRDQDYEHSQPAKRIVNRMSNNVVTNRPRLNRDREKERNSRSPQISRIFGTTIVYWAFRFQSEIGRAVSSEDGSCKDCNGYRVPVEQPDLSANAEICEKCHREIPIGINRHPPCNVACGSTKKDGKENIGKDENEIPEPLPHAIVDVPANFDGNAAQDQAPQNQKQSEVITSESRSQEARKDRQQCSPETDKPHF